MSGETESGKGRPKAKRKVVSQSADLVPKVAVEPDPLLALDASIRATPERLDRNAIRELALDELAKVAVKVARNIGLSAKSRKQRPRRSGQASADAKWVLETLLEHTTPAPEGASTAGGRGGSVASVHDLAERRRELHNLLRQRRRDMNK